MRRCRRRWSRNSSERWRCVLGRVDTERAGLRLTGDSGILVAPMGPPGDGGRPADI